MIHGYTSTSASNKFLTGKSMVKYASVDQLLYSDNSSKPSLKVKSSKLQAKMKNSTADNIFQHNFGDSELKYSSKNLPSNLKASKERKSKLKKKKSKQDIGFLDKQSTKLNEGRGLNQEPLSVNIVNTNHLQNSLYGSSAKPSASNTLTAADSDKKENFHSIIKSFKPNQLNSKSNKSREKANEEKKIKKFKQEVHTTKPKKNATSEGKNFLKAHYIFNLIYLMISI